MQIIVVLIAVATTWYYKGESSILASFYGGMIAVVNSFLLARRVSKAGEIAKTDPKQGVYLLYFGAVERFVLALIALGVGLSMFKLDPVPLLLTFGVAQLAYMIPSQSSTKPL